MENTERKFLNVKPETTRLLNLMDEITAGEIKVPVFQRDFIWKSTQMLELFDSILKGYPIGSLLLWRPNNKFKTKDYIGPYLINSSSTDIRYVLDGFQRLSTLFGTLTHPNNPGVTYNKIMSLKDFSIYYNLKTKEFTHSNSKLEWYYYIPLYKIVDTFEFIDFLNDLQSTKLNETELKQLIESAKEVNKIIYDYQIPHVEIKGGDIKSAVEIFSRINSTGTEISQDFMLSALSYNHSTGFLLSDKISEFLDSLSIFNFENLKRDTILNCISNSLGKVYFDIKTEDLLKLDLEKKTASAFQHIFRAVHFLYTRIKVWDVKLLPYPTQLIFISEYFRINPVPNEEDQQNLENWFWKTTYSNYFTIYSLSQQREAYRVFIEFAKGIHNDGVLTFNEKFETAKFPEKINFTGVRTKALQLFMIRNEHENHELQEGSQINEVFFTSKRDRSPWNVILRSDLDGNYLPNDVENLYNSLPPSSRARYFLSEEIFEAYRNDNYITLESLRHEMIENAEKSFVESLGIRYSKAVKPEEENGIL